MSRLIVWRVRRSGRLALLGTLALAGTTFAQQPCEKLAELKLTNVEITSAALLPAGNISTGSGAAAQTAVPARCIVKAIARPTLDSEI
jgi:hypothetical protein